MLLFDSGSDSEHPAVDGQVCHLLGDVELELAVVGDDDGSVADDVEVGSHSLPEVDDGQRPTVLVVSARGPDSDYCRLFPDRADPGGGAYR